MSSTVSTSIVGAEGIDGFTSATSATMSDTVTGSGGGGVGGLGGGSTSDMLDVDVRRCYRFRLSVVPVTSWSILLEIEDRPKLAYVR